MRVYVTGATGLLGSHLAEHLRDRGYGVVALCRREADVRFLRGLGCTIVEGDVRDPSDTLAPGMAGCTHIVHGAGLVYAGGAWPKVRAVNVEGTRNVLTAAARAGLKGAVHLSSVAVYGSVEGPIDESFTLAVDETADLYARSKREGEEVAREVEAEHGLPVTVLRPSAVYGERDRLMAPAIADILRLPVTPLFGPGDNTLPVVYAGNVAVAIGLAIDAGRGLETFDVGLDRPLTQRELFEHLARGMGKRPHFVHLPSVLVWNGARALAWVGIGTPGAKHLRLDRVARLALGENPHPSRRIRSELGWDPPHEHRDALARTGAWLTEGP